MSDTEAFWAGEFGDRYVERNRGPQWIAGNYAMFGRVLRKAPGVSSVLELGANIGMNLAALGGLLPDATLDGVEINEMAVDELRQVPRVTAHHGSLLDFAPGRQWDLVLTSGVLIHISPEALDRAYGVIDDCAARYICVAEYFNPTPVEVPYRGHPARMWQRDFAGELLERISGLTLVDYGFVYHGDPVFPLDDLTWFLLKKC